MAEVTSMETEEEPTIRVTAICCRHKILGSRLATKLVPKNMQRWHWHFMMPVKDFFYPNDLKSFIIWAHKRYFVLRWLKSDHHLVCAWRVEWVPEIEMPLSHYNDSRVVDQHMSFGGQRVE